MIRCLLREKTRSRTGVISCSEVVKPGTSALVESVMNRSTPSSPRRAKVFRSVIRRSSGSWSILKSPVWRTVPAGVWIATASASGIEWFTATNSSSKGPKVMASPSRTTWWTVSLSRCSRSLGRTSDSVRWEPTSGMSPARAAGTAWRRCGPRGRGSARAPRRRPGGPGWLEVRRIRSTPGWWSSGNSTPQSTSRIRPPYSNAVMLRPTSPRPPSGMTRRAPVASGPGADSSGWVWVIGSFRVARARLPRWREARRREGRQSRRPAATRPARSAATSSSSSSTRGPRTRRLSSTPSSSCPGLGGGGAVVGGAHDGVDGRHRRGVGRQRGRGVAGQPRVDHGPQAGAGDVADDADHPDGAVGEPAEVGLVVAGVDGVAHLREPDAAGEVADRVLDGDDGLELDRGLVGLERDLGGGAARHVVQHHRDVGGADDGAEVLQHAGLAGLGVVRRDEQQPVGAELGGLLGELDAVGRRVRADARDDDRVGTDGLAHGGEDVAVLAHAGGRRLPRRAGDDHAVVTGGDEVRRDGGGAVEVDRAVRGERRGHRGEHAAERDVLASPEALMGPRLSPLVTGAASPRRRRAAGGRGRPGRAPGGRPGRSRPRRSGPALEGLGGGCRRRRSRAARRARGRWRRRGADLGVVRADAQHLGGRPRHRGGSRPASSQAARTRANCSAVAPTSPNGRLNSVAYAAARAGVRFLPRPPTITGSGCWTGFGSAGESTTSWARPA